MKLGFVGLGNMGQPMARNLLAAGHQVRSTIGRASAPPICKTGRDRRGSPAEVSQAEVVLSMLADDRAVEDIVFGSRGRASGDAESRHSRFDEHDQRGAIETPGRSARTAGQGYIAAPVFGRPEAAAAAKLIVVAAGRAEWIERVRAPPSKPSAASWPSWEPSHGRRTC